MTDTNNKYRISGFIKDGLLLTFTTLILRTAGIFFSARLSIIAGTAVLGIYTQIMSIYAFAATAATAGVNLGALRITSESYGRGETRYIRGGMSQALKYCLKIGAFTCILLALNADFFGTIVLRDSRTVSSLRTLSLALPFISVANAFHGYFNGIKRIYKSIVASVCEQGVRITLTLLALTSFTYSDAESMCLTLIICNVTSEVFSCTLLSLLYRFDSKRYPLDKRENKHIKKRFTAITVPLAISALIRSGLTSAEHILIPIGLRMNGADNDLAMSKYGTASGMVMPILLYPMALLSSFASITVTNLSSRISAGENENSISKTVSKGISLTLKYAIGVTAIIHYYAEMLALKIYHSQEAGIYLRIMAPLIFLMYLDHISDGMLKGMDKQNYVMKINIIDASLSVVFAIFLIPAFGIYGFISSVYICELLNCICSFGMILKLLPLRFSIFEDIVTPIFCSSLAVYLSSFLASDVSVSIIASAVLYLILLYSILGLKKNYNFTSTLLCGISFLNKRGIHYKRIRK